MDTSAFVRHFLSKEKLEDLFLSVQEFISLGIECIILALLFETKTVYQTKTFKFKIAKFDILNEK